MQQAQRYNSCIITRRRTLITAAECTLRHVLFYLCMIACTPQISEHGACRS